MTYLYWEEYIDTNIRPYIKDGKRMVDYHEIFEVKKIPLDIVKGISPCDEYNRIEFTPDAERKDIWVEGTLHFGNPTRKDFDQWSEDSVKSTYLDEEKYILNVMECYCEGEIAQRARDIKSHKKEYRNSFTNIISQITCRYSFGQITSQTLEEIRQLILAKCAEELGRSVKGNLTVTYERKTDGFDYNSFIVSYDDEFFLSLGEIL